MASSFEVKHACAPASDRTPGCNERQEALARDHLCLPLPQNGYVVTDCKSLGDLGPE